MLVNTRRELQRSDLVMVHDTCSVCVNDTTDEYCTGAPHRWWWLRQTGKRSSVGHHHKVCPYRTRGGFHPSQRKNGNVCYFSFSRNRALQLGRWSCEWKWRGSEKLRERIVDARTGPTLKKTLMIFGGIRP